MWGGEGGGEGRGGEDRRHMRSQSSAGWKGGAEDLVLVGPEGADGQLRLVPLLGLRA